MQSQKEGLKSEGSATEQRTAKWSGLQARMTLSYVLVTLIAAFVLEILRYILFLLVPLPPVPWYVLLGVDIFLLLVVPLIGGLFGVISTQGLVDRIHKLAVATTLFAEGQYDQRLPVRQKDEVGQLEQHFNQMAEQIVESIAQRQQLAEQGARQAERNRIARDLHDSVKQQTFAVSMQISAALALLDQDKDAAHKHMLEAETLVYQIQQELTTLIHELRSPAFQDKELAVVLQDYVLSWSRQYGITATLHMPETCVLPFSVEEALLRVAQEALSNIVRHSHATTVQVSLECSQEQVVLSIADNGKGFNSDRVSGSGVGLHSMRERMEALKGTVSIESTIGQGTLLVARCACVQVQGQ